MFLFLKNSVNESKIIYLFIVIMLLLFIISTVLLTIQDHANLGPPSAAELAEYSMTYLKDGGNEEVGKKLDCSGYTRHIFNHYDIYLPNSSKEQLGSALRLRIEELETGNLVFFITNGKDISHAGIYLGDHKFIHSPGIGRYVTIDSLNYGYWMNTFVCGRRIALNEN